MAIRKARKPGLLVLNSNGVDGGPAHVNVAVPVWASVTKRCAPARSMHDKQTNKTNQIQHNTGTNAGSHTRDTAITCTADGGHILHLQFCHMRRQLVHDMLRPIEWRNANAAFDLAPCG